MSSEINAIIVSLGVAACIFLLFMLFRLGKGFSFMGRKEDMMHTALERNRTAMKVVGSNEQH